jgi:hypothetical protein
MRRKTQKRYNRLILHSTNHTQDNYNTLQLCIVHAKAIDEIQDSEDTLGTKNIKKQGHGLSAGLALIITFTLRVQKWNPDSPPPEHSAVEMGCKQRQKSSTNQHSSRLVWWRVESGWRLWNERKPVCQYKAGDKEQVDLRTLNKMEPPLGWARPWMNVRM